MSWASAAGLSDLAESPWTFTYLSIHSQAAHVWLDGSHFYLLIILSDCLKFCVSIQYITYNITLSNCDSCALTQQTHSSCAMCSWSLAHKLFNAWPHQAWCILQVSLLLCSSKHGHRIYFATQLHQVHYKVTVLVTKKLGSCWKLLMLTWSQSAFLSLY